MAMRRQLPGGAEMQGNAYQPTTWRRETLGIAACVSLVLSGCGGGKSADVTLPIDPVESAALCYGATMALTQERVGKGSVPLDDRSEEHTSELQSLMRISYAVFCLKKKKHHRPQAN